MNEDTTTHVEYDRLLAVREKLMAATKELEARLAAQDAEFSPKVKEAEQNGDIRIHGIPLR
jgi:hypothetical protein